MRKVIGIIAFCVLGAGVQPIDVVANPGRIEVFFKSELFKYVFRHTRLGRKVINQVNRTEDRVITELAYERFVYRLSWDRYKTVRERLLDDLQKIESEFAEIRKGMGKDPKLGPEELFTRVEIDEIRKLTRPLKQPELREMIEKASAEIRIPLWPYKRLADKYRIHRDRFVETRPDGRLEWNGAELESAGRTWVGRWWHRKLNHLNFFRSIQLSLKDWRTVFFSAGRDFTPEQVKYIRDLNRILDAVNQHTYYDLLMKTYFEVVNPAMLLRVNLKTAEALKKFKSGDITIEELVKTRQKIAEETYLSPAWKEESIRQAEKATNGFSRRWMERWKKWWEGKRDRDASYHKEREAMGEFFGYVEARLLSALDRVSTLGGSRLPRYHNEHRILNAEQKLRLYEDRIGQASSAIQKHRGRIHRTERRIEKLQGQLGAKGTDQYQIEFSVESLKKNVAKLKEELKGLETERQLFERDYTQLRKEIENYYVEFVENYEVLNRFLNVRSGNGKYRTLYDFDDVFVADPTDVLEWARIYDRAFQRVPGRLVKKEIRLYWATRLGATRDKIHKLNGMVKRVIGKKITDTEAAREFYRYSESRLVAVFKEMAHKTGLGAGVAVAGAIGKLFADRVWYWVTGEDAPWNKIGERGGGGRGGESSSYPTTGPRGGSGWEVPASGKSGKSDRGGGNGTDRGGRSWPPSSADDPDDWGDGDDSGDWERITPKRSGRANRGGQGGAPGFYDDEDDSWWMNPANSGTGTW